MVRVNGKLIQGLLDTGADRTCIAGKDWPSAWPCQRTSSSLLGLGITLNVAQSSNLLRWELEGKTGMIQSYVIPSLPFSLWGRDIMEDMDLKLVSSDNLNDQHFS